jgi:hypothetical protein
MVQIMTHLRETRWRTEKTNLNLLYGEKPVYSTEVKQTKSFVG